MNTFLATLPPLSRALHFHLLTPVVGEATYGTWTTHVILCVVAGADVAVTSLGLKVRTDTVCMTDEGPVAAKWYSY